MGADATNRPCLIVNPRSFRASWLGYARRGARLAHAAGLDVHQVFDPSSVCALLDRLRASGQQQIWVLAGDGTLHAMADYFAARGGDWSPGLLLLAGGRANLVPRECGGYPAMPMLRKALAAWREGRPLREERLPTLQVSQAGQPTRHGFLLAGAMIHDVLSELVAHRAAGWWRTGFFSGPYVYTRLIVLGLLGRKPLPPAAHIVTRLAGRGELAAPVRILLASTLELRRALYNPFAARGTGPVRLTAIAADAPRFWRRLPKIIKGRFDNDMDLAQGFLSGRGERAELLGVAGYALDGEIFAADPAQPLVFTAGVALKVLHP
ncbi:MAG: diacylglycerol kinase family protein [Pseudomonadota bacterium]